MKNILQEYKKYKIEMNAENRWEKATKHHPKSEELMRHVMEIDYKHNDDYFGFKIGGDGDNGEQLMYLMDAYFEMKEKKDKNI
jgi:hypothetical protein